MRALGGLALSLLAACGSTRAAPEALPLAPCQLAHPSAPARVEARCGTLEVPESWARPEGRRISLRVAVVKAESTRAEPDPVFLLAGGPGQAVTEQFPAVAPALERLRRDRDIVLVDQRGTGGSGRLACPPSGDALQALARSDAEEVALVAACARSLPVDLTQYTTAAFVQDLDRVRAALGYGRVNLVGVSYGTRAALVYLRTFPARVRTLVLDGVAPLQMPIGAFFDRDGQRALDLAWRRCQADAACRARFPGLEARFAALLARLDGRPQRVRISDPVAGEAREVPFGGSQLRRAVFLFTYAPETTALLPVLLDGAARGEVAPLAAQGLLVVNEFESALSRPLQYSVLCAEDVPFYPASAGDGSRGYLGDEVRRTFRAACGAWPHAAPAPGQDRPVRSDVPALLLSGEADPVTPPSWGELAAKDLPRSRHLVLPGGGHGTLVRGCVPGLVARFVARGSADGLDASCLERARPSPFFLDLLGPSP
jgi:pimeloyl-ACP methyl ester carboxylesterase